MMYYRLIYNVLPHLHKYPCCRLCGSKKETMTEQHIKLAAKLYRCRDTAKRFFGVEFQDKIHPYKQIISGVAKDKKIDEIDAVMQICEDETIKNSGWTVVLLMAAAVELVEPSAVA